MTQTQLLNDCHADHFAALEADCFDAGWDASNYPSDTDRVYVSLWMNQTCVCYICGRIILDEVELWRMASSPRHRRQGLARKALAAFLKESHQRGGRRVFLEVSSTNQAAVNFYLTSGFTQMGQRKDYYGSGDDALIMGLDLSGVFPEM